MNNKSRVRWRCRRGIREMDILFQHFIDEYYDTLNPKEKDAFESFLEESDLDILNWVMGRTTPDNNYYIQFVHTMQSFNSK